jgi:predicted esterase
MIPTGQVQYVKSRVDGNLYPCAVCATDTTDQPKPLIIEVSPGAFSHLPECVQQTEQIAALAVKHGKSCVALRPTGRGDGSVYQNYGEVDVLDAIEHVKAHYAIDPDRISITGSSMGGAATWYLASHYPDLFAAAAPFCGYCDYRLWKKPGGYTFHMQEWEEPSWMSRSAAFLVENLEHTKIWMIHGEWDRAIGGGVDVAHSRQMADLFTRRHYDFRYTEVPATGHGCRLPEIFEEVVIWLLEQEKPQRPSHVTHSAFTLRHNTSYWVSIEQLLKYGEKGTIDAHILNDAQIKISTDNVRAFSLRPREDLTMPDLEIDSSVLAKVDLDNVNVFRRDERGQWQNGGSELFRGGKRHRTSGPIGDMFFDAVILVPGTSGTDYETHVMGEVAHVATGFYKSRNGGVHRGGIMGQNSVDLPVIRDCDLTDALLRENNLLLYGTFSSNSVLARMKGKLPICFDGDTLVVSDREYHAAGCAAFAVFPHPENPKRYVAVNGGITPDAICGSSHFDMHLLPDFIVYDKEKLIDWGFWNNEWRS